MLLSIFYVLSFIILFTGILYIPKNEKKCSIAEWSVVSLLTVFALHTAAGVLLYVLLKIKITLVSVGIFNMLLGAVVWGLIIFVYKRIQKYYSDILGWPVLGVLLLVTIITGMVRFGNSLDVFRYATSDSAVHLFRTLRIVDTGELAASRFYTYIIDALAINVLSPVVGRANYYRIFIMCDLFMWFLSGAVFFALIRKYVTNKKKYICCVIFVLLYFFGYPMNNLMYGFNYLGACVTIAGYVLYVVRCLEDERMPRWMAVVCVCLGNLSAALCYTQFFPVVFGGSVLCMAASFLFGKRRISIKIMASVLALCLVVGLSGVFYILKDYGSLEVLFSNLEGEGPIYRDLWSNIFLFLVFIVIYARVCIRLHKIEPGYLFFITLVIYALYFFIRVCKEQTASYYFYKFHYLGWLYVLYMACRGLLWSVKEYEGFYKIYGSVILVVMLVMLSGVEDRLSDANVWWVPQTKADAYLDIYKWNRDAIVEERTDITDDMQELYHRVAQLVVQEDCVVPYLGSWENYWLKYYYNLTCQEEYYEQFLTRMDDFAETTDDIAYLLEQYVYSWADNVRYLMFEKDSDAYWYGLNVYNQMEVVFENDYGIVFATGR